MPLIFPGLLGFFQYTPEDFEGVVGLDCAQLVEHGMFERIACKAGPSDINVGHYEVSIAR